VDAGQSVRCLDRHGVGDAGADVAALFAEELRAAFRTLR
jgi:hypothetical protein